MKKIVLASSNVGKMQEIRELLAETPVELIAQSKLDIEDAEETGTTFIENAIIKARHAANCAGMPAISDDSGLTITALNDAPGVYSSRYAGPNSNDNDRIRKVLQDLQAVDYNNRSAAFHCVIALMRHADDPAPIVAHGVWTGEILLEPRGDKGFGYDPIFYSAEYQCSAAELEPAIKNKISHRARAMTPFIKALKAFLA